MGAREPIPASLGRIVQQSPGVDYPADSFFDVFFDVSLDEGATWLPVDQPLRMEAVIQAIPPILAYYQPPQPIAVPVIGHDGQVIATIRYALHIPLPPREKVIIFINYRPPTPTPTSTDRATVTPTLTPTATPKPVLTGVSSTFFVTSDNVVVITVHVIDPSLSGLIWDMEIYFNEQTPPWPGGTPISGPQGWQPFPVPGGIGWMTSSNPLQFCQPVQFVLQFPPGATPGNAIWLHMTDQNHNNLGYVISQRVRQPGVVPGSAFCIPD